MVDIALELFGPLNNNVRRQAKFTGANLASGTGYHVGGDKTTYTLFLTRGGSLVGHAVSERGSTVEVFRTFDDFKSAVEYRTDGEY